MSEATKPTEGELDQPVRMRDYTYSQFLEVRRKRFPLQSDDDHERAWRDYCQQTRPKMARRWLE